MKPEKWSQVLRIFEGVPEIACQIVAMECSNDRTFSMDRLSEWDADRIIRRYKDGWWNWHHNMLRLVIEAGFIPHSFETPGFTKNLDQEIDKWVCKRYRGVNIPIGEMDFTERKYLIRCLLKTAESKAFKNMLQIRGISLSQNRNRKSKR